MTYYRVDKRKFVVGQRIETAGQYYAKFTDIAKAIEDSLENNRPQSKPIRTSCLFLFCDEKCAKKHWSKMSEGKLYSVDVDEDSVLHTGDMALMDQMKSLYEQQEGIIELARDYWSGKFSTNPEVEVLVQSALVLNVISDCDTERKAYLKNRYMISR